jgi:hypothetical protein
LGAGISPSCKADKFPPGNTCAEGKEVEVWTRCKRRISLDGDIRRILLMLERLSLGNGRKHTPRTRPRFWNLFLRLYSRRHILLFQIRWRCHGGQTTPAGQS